MSDREHDRDVDSGAPVLGAYDERLAGIRDDDVLRDRDRLLDRDELDEIVDDRRPGPRCDLNGHYYRDEGGRPSRQCLHCRHFARPFEDEYERRVRPGDEIESNRYPGVRRRVLALWHDPDNGTDATLETERQHPEAQPLDRVRLGDWRVAE